MKTYIIITSLLFVGCATQNKSNFGTTNKVQKFKIRTDQQALQVRAQEERNQDNKDRARVMAGPSLKSRQGMFGPMISASPQGRGKMKMNAPNSILKPSYKGISEGQLLAEIRDRYQANDRIGFQNRSMAFLSRFPNGDSRDEVLYLKGMLELMDKNYGVSLVQFNTILRDHPNGRRAPSAMFAKGILYRRMNLLNESRQTLGKVLAQFPGSPESVRAKMELRVIR